MYNVGKDIKSGIKRNTSYQGETIEAKVNRIVNNKEPINDGAPIIYTDRANGVMAEYNIRADKWEIALDAMDYVSRSHQAKRQQRIDERKGKTEEKQDGGTESTQATE